MLAQRQLAVAAVRAEVKRHEVAKQALSRLRKLSEKVGDPELRDSIQASLNSIRVPLEQVMTTQGGSAAMATPSATSSCPPQPSSPVVGPWQEQLIHPQGPITKELMELDIVSGLLSSHSPPTSQS